MSLFYPSARGKLIANESGQATVELALAVTLLLIVVCSVIDFARALNDMQIISELTRQGSNIALVGTGTTSCDTSCTAVAALLAGDSGLDLASNGRVIITSFTQASPAAGGPYTVAEQVKSASGIAATSKVAPSGSGTANIAGAPALQTNQTMYVTEIFYTFTAATPIGALTNNVIGMPSTLYDIAYF